ncbi:MAG: hypothetical protein JW768_05590 [Chitinispirillaceae bacterium]|nr:hypothetical protein [Chitinispirillaceae bacterium]
MKNSQRHNRRTFLKIAGAGTMGIAALPGSISAVSSLFSGSPGWRDGLKINDFIDNVKAVCCYDEGMVESKLAGDFAQQNAWVNTERVARDMDDIAKNLANESDPPAAWQKIFRKPTAKNWNEVKAAIKVNCANTHNMPRIAIVGKVCTELINAGVPAANITLYDSLHNATGTGKYGDSQGNPITGLPSGIVVSTATLTGPIVPVGSGTMQCSPVIARESAGAITYIPDILVNIAVNQGVDTAGSEPGLCMSNHIGTLKYSTPSADELIAMNQCEAIIGHKTDEVPCRQQLCIVDSLWALVGPAGELKAPCRIVMGTLPPVVDFLTAEYIRKPPRIISDEGTTYNTTMVNNWLSSFGYAASDCLQGWVQFTPSTRLKETATKAITGGTIVKVSLSSARTKKPVLFRMSSSNRPIAVSLFNLSGRRLHAYTLPPSSSRELLVGWNGLGSKLRPGRYVVSCAMGREQKTASVLVD